MKASDTFKDYNYHGANMTMILELLSYLADFNSFHTNMVAKNVFMDSASVFETVHALAQQKGYNPRGFISSWVTVTIEISGSFDAGDQIYIEPWKQINTGLQSDNGDQIYYTITDEVLYTVPASGSLISFEFPMRQGKFEQITYTGEDLVDNKIILPFHNYDHGSYPFTRTAIDVFIQDEKWERVVDFYDLLSGLLDIRAYENDEFITNLTNEKSLENDDVFMFKYDKYRRYVLEFNSSRNVPRKSDDITINALESLGSEGVISKFSLTPQMIISTIESEGASFIHNITQDVQIDVDQILTFTNFEPSVGGSNPENIEEIKIGARSNVHSQYRNITRKDYRYHLEARTDVIKGLAWGEQEVDPGNVLEYNKTYISVIPTEGTPQYDSDGNLEINPDTGYHYPYLYSLGTINTNVITWEWIDDLGQVISAPIEIASSFVDDFRNDVYQYLEPRKMLNNYEVLVLPDIVYFRFDIGIRVRRTYTYRQVMEDVRDKLIYFFDRDNRFFNEEISFMDIHNFILDLSITSNDNDFKYIAGADNLVLRDLNTYTTFNTGDEQVIFEPPTITNDRGRFPQYKYDQYQNHIDNKLRPILLDFNQFPMLVVDMCRFFKEI